VKRTVVYGVLRRLTSDDVIEKRDDPDTGSGYALASAQQGGESAADAPPANGETAGNTFASEPDMPV